MSAYTEAAPILSQWISEAQFMVDFPEPPPPTPPPPEPNAAKKLALYNEYKARFNANGGGAVALSQLARDMGVPRRWCVIVDREVRAAIAALYVG